MADTASCKVCEGLRSRYVSPSPATMALGDALRMRTYGEFAVSSIHGCPTCGFILEALQHFDPSSDNARSVLLRITHTGFCQLFMTNTCSTIQVYTPKGIPSLTYRCPTDSYFATLMTNNSRFNADHFETGEAPAWPGIVVGAELSTSSGSQQALAFIEMCMNMCDAQHSRCKISSPQLPTRLIEVDQEDTSCVRLVETAKFSKEYYIALSYCWGSDGNLKTTVANYDQMLSAIPVAALPQTLQDAIEITRKLGQKYIWVDAICIIQDSTRDWETESATMASVYRNAYLTIAAGTATTATEGFLAHHYPAADYPAPFRRPWRTEQGLESVLAARMVPDLETHSDDEGELLPLDTRGWCLQERLLSTRLLTYKDHELYWTCLASSMCECSTRDHLASQLIRVGGDNRIPYVSLFDIKKEEAWDKWKMVVTDYAHRFFTNQKDKLPAIAGVATIIQTITKSEYLAGLWKDDLVLDLTWECGNQATASLSKFPCAFRDYIAPTFSWASCPEVFSYEKGLRFSLMTRNMTWFPKCKVLECGSVVRGGNYLGQVESGFIRLMGHISKAVLRTEIDEYDPSNYHWKVAWGGTASSFYADTRLEDCLATGSDGIVERSVRRSPYDSRVEVVQSGAPVFLLYLGKSIGTYGGKKKWFRIFLLLGRSPAQAGAFERIGTVTMGDYGNIGKLRGKNAEFEEVEITLI